MAWTTTQLLAHVRRVASFPTSSTMAGYTDADLLAHADAVLQGRVAALVAKARDEHAVHFVDVSVPAGQQFVRLPPRVGAGRLRDVTVAWPSVGATSYVSVPRLEPEDIATWLQPVAAAPNRIAFVMQAGFLQIVPQPNVAVTLRISYLRAPPTLAAVSTCFAATGLTAGSPVVVTHAGTTTSVPFDFVMVSNGDSLTDNITPSAAGAGSTSFLSTSMNARFINTAAECARYLAEGFYLCPSGTSCIVPLPDMLSPLLAMRTAAAATVAIGDFEAGGRLEAQADNMERELVPLISERVEGEPQRLRPAMHRRRAAWGLW